jgi:hypothetical protein
MSRSSWNFDEDLGVNDTAVRRSRPTLALEAHGAPELPLPGASSPNPQTRRN